VGVVLSSLRHIGWRFVFYMPFLVIVALSATFLTTPGLFLDPVRVVNTYFLEAGSYFSDRGSLYPYSIVGFGAHVFANLDYLFSVVFSRYAPISIPLSCAAIIGIYDYARRNTPQFVVIASFVGVYFLFISSPRLMQARNLMTLVPFLALFMARGIVVLYSIRWARPFSQAAIVLFLTVSAGVNSLWLFSSAATVFPRSAESEIENLRLYIKARPDWNFVFSPEIKSALSAGTIPDMVKAGASSPYCVLFYREVNFPTRNYTGIQANIDGYYTAVLSSMEVNYDYYPTWTGRNSNWRILILPLEKSRKMGFAKCDA
ncbi:MAG: hypothetical protein OEY85_05810, partial [Rhodospirillales bacterium]|nr:hypothetical protein [Rhodospirillales bacterium]